MPDALRIEIRGMRQQGTRSPRDARHKEPGRRLGSVQRAHHNSVGSYLGFWRRAEVLSRHGRPAMEETWTREPGGARLTGKCRWYARKVVVFTARYVCAMGGG
jgi:hypothetical protein